jgi:hypothetical protein
MMLETTRTIGLLSEAAGAGGLALLVAFTAISMPHTPARIAIQFDPRGAPRTWAGRGALWGVVVMGAFFFFLMTVLNPAVSVPGEGTQEVSKAPALLAAMFAEGIWLIALCQWVVIRAAGGARPNLGALLAGAAVMAASVGAIVVASLSTNGALP